MNRPGQLHQTSDTPAAVRGQRPGGALGGLLFGETHPRGTQFLVLQRCANHDEEAYDDAEAFDVARFAEPGSVPPPLSFGWVAHHCLGSHLARAEGEIVFSALLERFARIELDGDALAAAGHPDRRARYRPSLTLRGLEALPVRVS